MSSTMGDGASIASTSLENSNQNESSGELFPGCSSITEFSQRALQAMLQSTRTSNDLPTGDDYDFYSTFDSVRNILDMEAKRLLQLLQALMRYENVKGSITGSDHALELDEQFDVIIDANDHILERVGTLIDEATGVKKTEHKLVVAAVSRPNPAVASWNKKKSGAISQSAPLQLLTARNIKRPQLSFRDKIDNSHRAFRPILRHKPHAFKPLQESLTIPSQNCLEDTESPDFVYPHPYQYELDQWQPLPHQLERVTPQTVEPVDNCPAQFIDTVADLAELCDLLKNEKEIAVDLEHHSFRSFQGFVCLMQLSTRQKDYLIDTLELRSDMYILNEVFTNPKITKVFHGADSDIDWLQRDFGLYVVNMFDTGQAARVLNHARFSLAHLLQVYCQVEADKQFQLSDWRMRPLHEKMLRYAQEDTHFLLYIYDRMRCELIDRGNEQKNLLQSVYQRSKNVCLRVYRKPHFTHDSHMDLYMKSKKVFNAQQLQALKSIYAWRDSIARQEDESTQYVLPNHMLLQIAEILPRERQGVLACCNPIPPLVRQFQHEIHNLIMEAREFTFIQGKEHRTLEPSPAQHPQYHTHLSMCPHDLSKQRPQCEEFDADIPESLPKKPNSSLFRTEINICTKQKPILSAFFATNSLGAKHKGSRLASALQCTFNNPFYKFLPQETTAPNSNILKPAVKSKGDVTWRLKKNTRLAGHKRKSDVDLNTFAPEFMPPAKSRNVEATSKATTTKLVQTCRRVDLVTETSPVCSQKKASIQKTEVTDDQQEENAISISQMLKKLRKEQQSQKALSSPLTPASFTQAAILSPETDEKKKKKKKKKNKLETSLTLLPAPSAEAEVDEEKKRKKKKKKKAKEEVLQTVVPFDYSTADKSALTGGKTKKRVYPDVYNPNFRGNNKGQKKNKKNRFGAKQRKSMTYKAGGTA